MIKRTMRACQVCGKPYYGSSDCFYCPACARAKKIDTVVKIRLCQDCGIEFYGGPRARRCPDCAYKAQQETGKRHQKIGTKRPLGSIDRCTICGKEYTVVSGRQKYCSAACQREGVLVWQREHKKGYDKASGQEVKKIERRKQVQKICVYCLSTFNSDIPTNLCSDYCRKQQQKLTHEICLANTGRTNLLDKHLKMRDEYRAKIKNI